MIIKTSPKIKISDALAAFNGNKSALAKYLGITPAAVTLWLTRSGREYVPAIHAYHLRDNHPDFK